MPRFATAVVLVVVLFLQMMQAQARRISPREIARPAESTEAVERSTEVVDRQIGPAQMLQNALTTVTPSSSTQQSLIVVSVQGVSCLTTAGTNSFAAHSWSFGSTNNGTVVSFQNLSVVKDFDGCSPGLFGSLAAGTQLQSVNITESDLSNQPLTTVQLSNVLVSSWQFSGSDALSIPTEQVAFSFTRITITDMKSGTKFCWDNTTKTSC